MEHSTWRLTKVWGISRATGTAQKAEVGNCTAFSTPYPRVQRKGMAALCLASQLCLTLCNLMDCSPPGSSVHGDSPGKNTGVGCHPFLQGIFSTQELNQGLLHCRRILYRLSHQEIPREWLLELKRRGSEAEKHLECFKVCTLRSSDLGQGTQLARGNLSETESGKMYPDLTSLLPTLYWCSPLAKLHLKPEGKETYQCCPYSSLSRCRDVCFIDVCVDLNKFLNAVSWEVVKSLILTVLGEKALSVWKVRCKSCVVVHQTSQSILPAQQGQGLRLPHLQSASGLYIVCLEEACLKKGSRGQ